MNLGVGLPTAGSTASPEAIAKLATGAERIGLASVWTFERQLLPTEPTAIGGSSRLNLPRVYASVYDPLETLSYVAAQTSTIRLGTSVVNALFQPPVVLARRIATLDQLSGGRAVIALGQGWMSQEFETVGVPASRRGAGFEEHIEAMRAAWGPDPVRFEGRFYRFAESEIGPKPVQPGGPPLLAGANATAAITRAARMGLGLNPMLRSWESLEADVRTFRQAAQEAGHDPMSLPIVVRVNGSITDAAKPYDKRSPLTGSVEQVAEDLPRLRALEVDEVFWSMSTPPAQQLDALQRLLAAG
ncbi:MAG: TIGR03619 family F420-dependent LLM class oxidoreductase [Micromonosporaceae bacterium]